MNSADICTMQAVMGQHIQALVSGVQLKNTGALGATQLHCLGRNDLQHTVQVEGGGNNPSDTVNGRQFMNFATQLLISLLVEASILAVNRDNARYYLQEVDLLAGEIARLRRLHTDDTDQTFDVAEKDNRQG